MAYNKSGFKMKNPMLLKSAKDGSPMQVNYKSPTKFNQTLVNEANDPDSGMNDKFRAIVKKAGPSMKDPMKMKSPAKRRKPKTEGVDQKLAEEKFDHAMQQRAYAQENQNTQVDDLGDKAEPTKMKSPMKKGPIDKLRSKISGAISEMKKQPGPSFKNVIKAGTKTALQRIGEFLDGDNESVYGATTKSKTSKQLFKENLKKFEEKKSSAKMRVKSPARAMKKSPTKMGHKSPAKAMKKSPTRAMKKSPAKVNPTQAMGGAKNKPSASPKRSGNFPRFS